MLYFVPGLGPRKAFTLRRLIRLHSNGGFSPSRRFLLENGLLTQLVWENASGYLNIFPPPDMTAEQQQDEEDFTFLDQTRIHPEFVLDPKLAEVLESSAGNALQAAGEELVSLASDVSRLRDKCALVLRNYLNNNVEIDPFAYPPKKDAFMNDEGMLKDPFTDLVTTYLFFRYEKSREGQTNLFEVRKFQQFLAFFIQEIRFPAFCSFPESAPPDPLTTFSIVTGLTPADMCPGEMETVTVSKKTTGSLRVRM